MSDPLAEIDQLKMRLWKYGKHLTSCRLNKDLTSWCDCGWKEIRETLAKSDPKVFGSGIC